MADDKKETKKETIFTKLLKDLERRKKARRKAGGDVGTQGKRIQTSPTVNN